MGKIIHHAPLATELRPKHLYEFVGQSHLVGEGKPLRVAVEHGSLHSMVLWGPPGSGKTTLAEIIARNCDAEFKRLSAISSGVKEIRALVEEANASSKQTILFMDEIHRYNRAQQDIFLPYIENGTFILIGATTENPSFELNSALLSRLRVYVLTRLNEDDLSHILHNALKIQWQREGHVVTISKKYQTILIQAADGDARQLLNLVEILFSLARSKGSKIKVDNALLAEVLQTNLRRFDKKGEAFYDQISALHKSVRGSAPNAALYWFCRMIDGGCDPLYIARRLVRMAAEDIGLADPNALEIALNAYQTYERLGSPEGELALAMGIIYLSCALKSNATYLAYQAAMESAKKRGSLEVPLHLRNAPTPLMKSLGFGKTYRYAHDEPNAYAAGEHYFPENMKEEEYYHPEKRGIEEKIAARLAALKELDKQANKGRKK